MRWLFTVGVCLLLAFAASVASAQIDIELSFDSDTAEPGDEVMLSGTLTNAHDRALFVYLQTDVSLDGVLLGRFFGRLPLEAGETTRADLRFEVPLLVRGGRVEVKLAGEGCQFTDEVTAALTIVRSTSVSGSEAYRNLGRELAIALGADETPTSVTRSSIGHVKKLYRE